MNKKLEGTVNLRHPTEIAKRVAQHPKARHWSWVDEQAGWVDWESIVRIVLEEYWNPTVEGVDSEH